MMFQAVHFNGNKIMAEPSEYLPRHNLVYQAPAYDGYEGIPLGNGEMGLMHWHSQREAIFALNRCDSIDRRPDGNFRAWSWEEEEANTALVSCARIRLTDGMPSFDPMYLESFQEVLALQDGTVIVNGRTPFSQWNYRAFVSREYSCAVIRLEASSNQPVQRSIAMERWGSRNFFHYYEQFVNVPSLKLDGVHTYERDGCLFIEQCLRGTRLVMCAALQGASFEIKVSHDREGVFILEPSRQSRVDLVFTAVAGREEDTGLKERAYALVKRCMLEQEEAERKNQEAWDAFWRKSFVHLDNDYLENLYYLYLYQMGASSMGELPALFCGSIWTWNRDVRNWGHVYHWNQQQQYWGMAAANHCELIRGYLDFRFSMLDQARRDAKQLFGVEGAFFSDICSLTGYQAMEPDTLSNFSVGAQIGADFYRYCCYTQDKEFLEEKAMPFMRACGLFYKNILTKGEDGYLHMNGATAYESYWNLKDTLTDAVAARVLFDACAKGAAQLNLMEEAGEWAQLAEDLYPIPEEERESGQRIFARGIRWDGARVGFEEGDYPLSPFTGCVLCPVYPAGLVTLQGSESLYGTAVNTMNYFLEAHVYGDGSDWCGHTPLPQIAARLGMKEELKKLFELYIEKFQCFPNGFWHYADIRKLYRDKSSVYCSRRLTGKETFTKWEEVHEKKKGDRASYPVSPYFHMYNETGGNVFAAVNEMLLQSCGGVIQVFPALPDKENAAFTLLAEGGFLVSSEKANGAVRYIAVKSLHGGLCQVVSPWEERGELLLNGRPWEEWKEEEGRILFDMKKDDTVIIQRKEFPLRNYYVSVYAGEENKAPKYAKNAVIGKDKIF